VIAERTENEIESQLSMFNHVVDYMGRSLIVNPFVECADRVLRGLPSRFLFARLQPGPPLSRSRNHARARRRGHDS
jgi:hypothetical protein